jgi:hypothetical protein
LSRNFKHGTAISLILLTTALLVAIFSQSLSIVSAQSTDATVVMLPSTGGTTSPVAGTYTYPNGTMIQLAATADPGYVFQYWIVSGDVTPGHENPTPVYITDPDTGDIIGGIPRPAVPTGIDSLVFATNPVNVTCGYGYTYSYQAFFAPSSGVTPTGNNATVIIMPTTGGTVSPTPGQYSYTNGSVITFAATPNTGYAFSYWLVTGDFTQGHTPASFTYIADDNGNIIAQIPRQSATPGLDSLSFTQNPAKVTCGYGYTYTYTAVFTPVSTTTPIPPVTATPTPVAATPTPTPVVTQAPTPTPSPVPASGDMTTTIIIVAVVVVIIIIIVIAAVMMRRKK